MTQCLQDFIDIGIQPPNVSPGLLARWPEQVHGSAAKVSCSSGAKAASASPKHAVAKTARDTSPQSTAVKPKKEIPKNASFGFTENVPATAAAVTTVVPSGDLDAQVKAIGDSIRELKAKLKADGLSGKAIDKTDGVKALVAKMTEIKAAQAEAPSPNVVKEKSPKQAASAKTRDMAPTNAMPAAVAKDLAGTNAGKTLPLWLEDTYCFQGSATLQSVSSSQEKVVIVTDRTIFHPQGGGQPTDVGMITADGLESLKVIMVALDKETGAVRHECTCDAPAPWLAAAKGTQVQLNVDEAVRRSNARLHSAGHFIDVAVAAAGYMWKPAKGYHFADGAYVEYEMTAEQKASVDKAKAVGEINAHLKTLLASPSAVIVELRSGIRTVEIENVSCPCGGTHVKNTSELIDVTVKALKAKGSNMRVSYTIPV